MKVNPWGLAPFEPAERSEEFSDGNGGMFTLRFRNTDGLGFFAPSALTQEWRVRFGTNGDYPLRFPSPNGDVVEVDEDAADRIAQLITMQVPDEGDPPYNLGDWAGFAKRRPDVFLGALRLTNDLIREEQERLGKSPKAASEPLNAAS